MFVVINKILSRGKQLVMKRKKVFVLLTLLIPLNFINPQISGISGAKLCVTDAGAIGLGTFEFEP